MHEFSVRIGKGTNWSKEFEVSIGNDQMDDYVNELEDAGAPSELISKIEDNDLYILTSEECKILYNILLKISTTLQDTDEDELITDGRFTLLKILRLGSENEGLEAR